jgi:hypothetical protein
VDALFLRVLVSPLPRAGVVDGISRALENIGEMPPVCLDPDIPAAVWNVRFSGDAAPVIAACLEPLRETAAESIIIFEVQSVSAARDPAAVAQLEKSVGDVLEAPVYVAQRTVPASAWIAARPISLGVDGFAVRWESATYPREGSRRAGVAIEYCAPTVLLKVALPGTLASALAPLCAAVGNERGGLLHIGAYPGVSVRSGDPYLLLECSDALLSPPARALEIIDIEAARYGGHAGQATLLSYVRLRSLLDTLAARMRLPVEPAQIIETHLAKP